MKRRRSNEGFTLLELTIAVLIMGSMAAMFAPGLSEWMADTRASAAAEELVTLSRVTRARVNDTGLAHLLAYAAADDANGSNALGKIQVWEGMNNHCNQTPWVQTMTSKDDAHRPVRVLDMGDSAYNLPIDGRAPAASDTGRQVIRIEVVVNKVNQKYFYLCFEPGGNTFVGTADGASPDIGFGFVPQQYAAILRVKRTIARSGGTAEQRGVDREVIFPAGGNGRLRL